MNKTLDPFGIRLVVLASLVFVYFVAFPDDAKVVLGLTNAVSPWFYGLAAVGIAAWTALRIWGKRESQ